MSEETVFYKFAFVVDGDVGFALKIPPHETQLKEANCLRNNPEIIEVEPDEGDLAKFHFVNDGVVNWVADLGNSPIYERFAACIRSNPTIIEVPPDHPVKGGWRYDGSDFHPGE